MATRARKPKRRLRIVGVVAGLLTVASTLTSAPMALGEAADELPPIEAVDPANEPYALPDPPPLLTDEQRLPVLDLSDIEGLWPKDIVEIVPGQTHPVSPTDAVDEASALPQEGAANVDAFGFGPDATNHIALVYPSDVNELKANGEWKDIAITLDPTADGWTWADVETTTTFPTKLSPETPVAFATAQGTLTMAPADSTSTEAQLSGLTLTYPGASGGGDLLYTPMLGGVQEQIVLQAPPVSPTFSFALQTTGLTLAPNDFGGIDVLAGTDVVAKLPAPVAYDANPEPISSTGTYVLVETAPGAYTLEQVEVFDWETSRVALMGSFAVSVILSLVGSAFAYGGSASLPRVSLTPFDGPSGNPFDPTD